MRAVVIAYVYFAGVAGPAYVRLRACTWLCVVGGQYGIVCSRVVRIKKLDVHMPVHDWRALLTLPCELRRNAGMSMHASHVKVARVLYVDIALATCSIVDSRRCAGSATAFLPPF